jgi:hypothetical protein
VLSAATPRLFDRVGQTRSRLGRDAREQVFASWRRKLSLAVHVAHADNVLRGLFTTADDVEAASPSAGLPSSPAQWAASVPVLPRAAPLVASMYCVFLALRGSFLCSLMLHLLGLRTM